MLNNDFVKLALIVVGAILLFQVLNKYQLLPQEGYETLPSGSAPSMPMPAAPAAAPAPRPAAPALAAAATPPQPSDSTFAPVGAFTEKPKDCFPKDQLAAEDLLPKDQFSKWAAVNPDGTGDLKDRNFLTAGYHVGIDTVGQSLRNASHDLRSCVANPVVRVSPWNQSTIEADTSRRPFEIGGSC